MTQIWFFIKCLIIAWIALSIIAFVHLSFGFWPMAVCSVIVIAGCWGVIDCWSKSTRDVRS